MAQLMRVPAPEHDKDWVHDAVQTAIKLEFATIPPYLAALWSIKDPAAPAARSILEIVLEEMLHMATMCNVLAAIGGTPRLNAPGAVPLYPCALPGGVHPGLEVGLQGFSREAVRTFMAIELPEFRPSAPAATKNTFQTIGAFYTAIEETLSRLDPALAPEKQLSGYLGLKKVTKLDDVIQAIRLIKHQGEGSERSPEDTGPGDLSHYYRFGEIYHGRRLVKEPVNGNWLYEGPSLPPTDAWPVAAVPLGGYQRADVSRATWDLLATFDREFTSMLDQLNRAWETGSQDSFDEAVSTMSFGLSDPAVALMKTPIPSGQGNYGPCFRIPMS
ncbi:MAG: ferritin-like protein [Alphaproteobacteria bacterium]|nr:ferritin-like protein [Alphaproteobacteria bacterium]MBV8409340.1 ferritin-like protein [Alphaproteobacteria bacterium]